MSDPDARANLESRLHDFVSEVLLFGQAPDLDRRTPLFELGVLDSLGTINLLAFIEREFAVAIPLEQVEPAHLRDISTIAEMVLRRL